MVVCKYCLQAIESHEGHRRFEKYTYTALWNGEDEETTCEWCDEEDASEEMYVI